MDCTLTCELDVRSFLDEGTGTYAVPRPTFENFIMAFSTCFLMMTGDRWKVTMYTYMQTTGIEAVIFFVMLWTVCSCIMINLFVAVIVVRLNNLRWCTSRP